MTNLIRKYYVVPIVIVILSILVFHWSVGSSGGF